MPKDKEKLRAELLAKIADQDKIIDEHTRTHKIEFFEPIGTNPKDIPYQTKILEILSLSGKESFQNLF